MKSYLPRRTKFPLTLILIIVGVAAFSFGLGSYVSHASVTLNGSGVTASSTSGNFLELTSSTKTLFSVDNSGDVGANQFYGSTVSAFPVPNLSFTSSGTININAGGTNQNINLNPSGTGATIANNLEDKGGQVFNVKGYGAVGNGTTDDTAAIQAAYQAAAAVDGIVYFPCGTYRTTSAISDSAAVTWEGASEGCVTIQTTANPTFDVFDVVSSNVHFKNITIDANATTSSTYNGVTLTNGNQILNDISFDHTTVENAGNWCVTWGNSKASGVSDLSVTKSTFQGCGGPAFGGITTGATSFSNLIFSHDIFGDDNTAPSNLTAQAHVSLYISNNGSGSVSNVTIDNNLVNVPNLSNGQESDGVVLVASLGSGGASMDNVHLSNNTVTGTSGSTPQNGHGFELVGLNGAAVDSNVISYIYNPVLFQAGTTGQVCAGTLTGNVISAENNIGVHINSGCPTTVRGNTISNSNGWGIETDSSHVTIGGNRITGSAGPIMVYCSESSACTNVVIDGNDLQGGANGNIFLQSTSVGVKNLIISGNAGNAGGSGMFLNVHATNDTGIVSGNTGGSYSFSPSVVNGLILKYSGTGAPSGTCPSGSQYINTSGASGTTFYGCEAGSWVAK